MPDRIRSFLSTGRNLPIFITVSIITVFSAVVLNYAGYSYAVFPLLIFAVLAAMHVRLKGRKDIIKDLFLFPLIFIETVYFFQLLTLIDVAEKKGIVFLACLLHENLVFMLIPLVLAFYLLVRTFGGHRAAGIIVPVPFALLTITDFYVTRFRGNEIIFSDLQSYGTAMNVAGNYGFNPVYPLALVAVPYVLTLICSFNLEKEDRKRRVYERIIYFAAAALSLSLAVYFTDLHSKDHKFETWDYNASIYNTFYMNFNMSLLKSIVIRPAGYSTDIIDSSASDVTPSLPDDPPNIIVIMNESYMDIDVYQNQTGDIEDPDPYWSSLAGNTIHGYALASVYGGNTANSEYEFLTGLSMADVPSGSVVFNQFLDEEVPSLPRFLGDLGYTTYAMHPFRPDSWSRDRIYPLMDFENLLFMDDFDYDESDIIRTYVSDRASYANLLRECDSNSGLGFYFLITIQNHGGYINDYNGINFTPSIYIDQPGTEKINNYLSLVRESDLALQYLLEELENRDERYIVLIFGDHQPEVDYIETDFCAGGVSWVIPYLIWTNYDMDPALINDLDHTRDYTSINYLSLDLLTAAGITPDAYYDLLYKIRSEVPCINTEGCRLQGESEFRLRGEDSGNAMRDLYTYITYDVLFDENDSAVTSVG